MAYAFSDIYTRILDKAGVSASDSTRLTQVKRAVNDAYKKWAAAKQWDELITEGTLNIKARYNTGTVAITTDTTALVGTSTVWTSALHLGWRIRLSGYDETYGFSAVGSNTTATLDQSYNGDTVTEAGYTLYQPKYSLSSDFDEFVDPHHAFWPYYPQPIPIDQMRFLYNVYPTTTGEARFYTIHDFDSSNNNQIIIWPIPDENYNLKYDYKKTITELSADSDVPVIPDSWREAILTVGGLAEMYDVLGDYRAPDQRRMFSRNLLSMVARQKPTDRQTLLEPTTYRRRRVPTGLGVYIDNSYFTRRRLPMH